MHTTNLYPTDPALVRLGAMQELMREFPVCAGWFIGSYTEQQCLYRSDGIGSKVSRETFYRLYGTYRSGYCMFNG